MSLPKSLPKSFLGAKLSERNFKNPPRDLGVLPFWFWNGDLKKAEMKRQIAEYKDKGLAGLFIHARFGLEVPFLSKGWFDRARFTAEECKKQGIQCWIYDEYNWPSGTAFKEVPNKYPELRQRYLEMATNVVHGPTFTFMEGYDSRYVEISKGDGKPIAAFAVPYDKWVQGTVAVEDVIDLTPNLAFEQVISWQSPPGKFMLLYFMEKEVPWYIDALNPESTKKFIEIGYESYMKAMPDLMGSTIPGFYTDEPAMHYYAVTRPNNIIPWTAEMFKAFKQRKGYDLKSWLPALFGGMGENTAKVRYDFWSTLSDLYEEGYYKQLKDWCNERGMYFIGHLLFEESLWVHARCGGNLFQMLRNLDVIGTDHLYPKIGTPEEPSEHVPLKIASSAAHHFDSSRVLCESLGGTYWDCTMARMKWIADWEYVLGVNLFNPHGFHYSIADERKRDWPPSQFYHHPWWEQYKLFADYMLRLSYMLSGGKHVAKIAMLYPMSTVWANYLPNPDNAGNFATVCERAFNYLTDNLLRLHYDFDYIDEDVLANAKVVKGKLTVKDESYELLLLPPLSHLKESSLKKMEQLVRSGGKVMGTSFLPLKTTAGKDITKRIAAIFGLDPVKEKANPPVGGKVEALQHDLHGKGAAFFIRTPRLYRIKDKDFLRQVMNSAISPEVEMEAEDIFYLHRQKDGKDIYFFANTSWKPQETTLRINQPGVPQRWNPEDGSTAPIYHYKPTDKGLEMQLRLDVLETALIVLDPKMKPELTVADGNVVVETVKKNEIIASGRAVGKASIKVLADGKSRTLSAASRRVLPKIELDKWQLEAQDDNALVLSDWKMQVEGEEAAGWVPVRPGIWEPQFPYERESAVFPVMLRFKSDFNCRYLPKNMRLLLDGLRGKYEIRLNGKLVKEPKRRSKVDVNISELPVSKYLKTGNNELEISLRVNSPTGGLLDPARLIGDFSVVLGKKAPTIAAPKSKAKIGSLVSQGFPHFSGRVAYSTTLDLPAEYLEDRKLMLEANCGNDVLEVEINGQAAGIRPWAPYALDITPFVQAGKNQVVVKIINTVTNLLEGNPLDFGLLEPIQIVPHNRYRFTK